MSTSARHPETQQHQEENEHPCPNTSFLHSELSNNSPVRILYHSVRNLYHSKDASSICVQLENTGILVQNSKMYVLQPDIQHSGQPRTQRYVKRQTCAQNARQYHDTQVRSHKPCSMECIQNNYRRSSRGSACALKAMARSPLLSLLTSNPCAAEGTSVLVHGCQCAPRSLETLCSAQVISMHAIRPRKKQYNSNHHIMNRKRMR